jgi:hypothetical protein
MGCLPLNLAVCLCVLSCASCPRAAWSCAVVSCLQALQRELPGPVMAVESLRGFLILAVGHRLEMHYKQVTRGYFWGGGHQWITSPFTCTLQTRSRSMIAWGKHLPQRVQLVSAPWLVVAFHAVSMPSDTQHHLGSS